jgi:methylase of polypeptide subunit release factors
MGVPGLRAVETAVGTLAAAVDLRDVTVQDLTSDLLGVTYRLLFVGMARRRGGTVDEGQALATLELRTVPAALLTGTLVAEVVAGLDPGECATGDLLDDLVALGALHEAVLELDPRWDTESGYRLRSTPGTDRKAAGAFFTPLGLVDHLLDEALEPTLDEVPDAELAALTVCDPACGSGIFLAAAAQRLARRGLDLHDVVTRCLVGVDRDRAAVELARVCLWLCLVEPGRPVRMPALRLHVEDALLAPPPDREYDVVVGNPPFLNQLERLTTRPAEVAARLDVLSEGTLRPYTDLSAVFLQRAVSWVRPDGRIALVQPQSVLAARDAAGVRRHVAATCALESLWASDVRVFGASVLTCAVVLRRGAPQGPVRRSHGPDFSGVPARRVAPGELAEEWAFLLAAGLGIPEVALPTGAGVLGDLAECTADFRDQYYGLAPFVREAEGGAAPVDGRCAPLVTSGLVEPAESLWGRAPTRFLKRRWTAPVIDLEALEGAPSLARWARRRLVPKVLVGTQGRVVEAVADVEGTWLPSVPTITVAAPAERLWHVLAVLLAPPVAAHAAVTYAGTALTMRAIKLSARQVAGLPLPEHRDAWDEGARLAELAQYEAGGRDRHLEALGRVMCRAYGLSAADGDAVLAWWLARLDRRLSPR